MYSSLHAKVKLNSPQIGGRTTSFADDHPISHIPCHISTHSRGYKT